MREHGSNPCASFICGQCRDTASGACWPGDGKVAQLSSLLDESKLSGVSSHQILQNKKQTENLQ